MTDFAINFAIFLTLITEQSNAFLHAKVVHDRKISVSVKNFNDLLLPLIAELGALIDRLTEVTVRLN